MIEKLKALENEINEILQKLPMQDYDVTIENQLSTSPRTYKPCRRLWIGIKQRLK